VALEDLIQQIKEVYYFFEDKYYELLDKANEKIPIYNIIDPIDKYFPSFILVILFFLFVVSLLLLLFFGGHGGPLEPVVKFIAETLSPIIKLFEKGGPLEPIGNILKTIFDPILKFFGFTKSPAKFIVTDEANKPVKDISVNFSLGKKTETKKTNASGEFTTEFYGKKINVSVDDNRFKKYADVLDIQPEKLYRIKLKKYEETKVKQIGIELRDEERNLIAPNVNVSLTFSCNNSGISPSPIRGNGPNHRISVQSNCGMLTINVSATGFNDARELIDLASFEGTKVIRLSKKKINATLRVSVKDKTLLTGIGGTKIKIKSNGITIIDGGYTDDSGSKIIPNVPLGTYIAEAIPPENTGYTIGQSNEFTIGAAEFSEGNTKTIEILLEKPNNAKKALLKFIDKKSSTAVEGVNTNLIIGLQNSGVLKTSGSDGIVSFINLEPDKNYSAIASHPEYVRKIIPHLDLKPIDSTQPQEIKIEKAEQSNSGKIKVIVNDYSRKSVPNASVAIYEKSNPIIFVEGETDSNGIFEANNMPPGNYYAEAVKYVDGAKNTGKSAKADLRPGRTLELPITIVLANGELAVKVVDVDGKAVQSANVSFIDSINGKELAKKITQNNGLTESVKFKVDAKPKLIIQKNGYLKTETGQITIEPDVKKIETVTLVKLPEPPANPEFKIELENVFKEDGRIADKIESGKKYVFKFRLQTGDKIENLKAVFRAGLQNQTNSNDSKIVITGINAASTEVVYSGCFNPENDYADCSITSGDAKQAVISLGTSEKTTYIISAAVKIKEIPETQKPDTIIEMRWGAKGTINGVETFKPKPRELYFWSARLDAPICKSNCGIVFTSVNLIDEERTIPLEEQKIYKLLEGKTYTLTYSLLNLSGKSYSNVKMTVKNKNALNPLEITVGNERTIGEFGANQQITGQEYRVEFVAKKPLQEADLNLSLNLGTKGDTFIANLAVEGLKNILLTLQPTTITAGITTMVLATAKDERNNPINEAEIKMYENPQDPDTQISKNTNYLTNNSGIVNLTVPPFESGKKIIVKAEKLPNYKTASAELQTVSIPLPQKETIQCVKFSKENNETPEIENELILQIQRKNTTNFNIQNECEKEIEIKLAKDTESDIVIKDSITRLSETLNESEPITLTPGNKATFNVSSNKQLGIHPIYVLAKYKGETKIYRAGIVKVIINDETARLVITRINPEMLAGDELNNKYTLDFLNGKEKVAIINKAYTGLEDPAENNLNKSYPYNDLANKFTRKLNITPLQINKTPNSREEILILSNTGLTNNLEDPFFLITIEDYYKGVD
jgi:hypothetical protein